jgi:CBS domain-containing protein
VEEIMTRDVISIDKDEELIHAIDLMKKYLITKMPVTNDGKLVGALTDAGIADVMGSIKSRGLPASRLHASSAMTKEIIAVPPGTPVKEVIQMAKKGETGLIHVVDEKKLLGVITNFDLLRFVESEIPLEELMTKNVHALGVEDRIIHARRIMIDKKIERLPVLDGGRLLGLVTETDVAFSLAKLRKEVSTAKQNAHIKELRVNDIMKTDLITTAKDVSAKKAAELMMNEKIGCLPVVSDDSKIHGIVTRTDLIKTIDA